MTREEAKRRVECCRDFLANNYSDMGEPNFTALNMAIEALSEPTKTEPTRTINRYERFVDQLNIGVDNLLKYSAGHISECNGHYIISGEQAGAEATFTIGQPIYDYMGNLMGYLGIGLYDALNYSTDTGLRLPVEHWIVCLPTEYCEVGKSVRTYWQNKVILSCGAEMESE